MPIIEELDESGLPISRASYPSYRPMSQLEYAGPLTVYSALSSLVPTGSLGHSPEALAIELVARSASTGWRLGQAIGSALDLGNASSPIRTFFRRQPQLAPPSTSRSYPSGAPPIFTPSGGSARVGYAVRPPLRFSGYAVRDSLRRALANHVAVSTSDDFFRPHRGSLLRPSHPFYVARYRRGRRTRYYSYPIVRFRRGRRPTLHRYPG